jgi:DUF4097 and DUF4098 domain-containing protein YvlB
MYKFSWSNTSYPTSFQLTNPKPFSTQLLDHTEEGSAKNKTEKIEMAKTQIYDVGKTPLVTITECSGEVVIKGEQTLDVHVRSDMADVAKTEKGLSIDSRTDLNLRVPIGASLDVDQARGNMVIKNVDGDVGIGEVNGKLAVKNAGNLAIEHAYADTSLKNINGDVRIDNVMGALAMRHVGSTQLGTVHADCAARYVNGDIQATSVMGDLALNTVNGNVDVINIMGDASLKNIGGVVNIQAVKGDALVYGGLTAGKHFIKAAGDVVVRWNVNEPVKIIATVEGDVRNKLPLQDVTHHENNFIGSLGDSETSLSLEVGGDLLLKPNHEHAHDSKNPFNFDFDFDFETDFSEFANIGEKINKQMEGLHEKFQQSLGPDFASNIARKAEKAVEQAMRRVEQAQEKAWRKAGTPPKPPTPPAPPTAPKATPAEQLKILKMLENGAITVEEATTLLEALEG